MIATALENNGATVYIVSKRLSVLEEAARKNNVGSTYNVISFRTVPNSMISGSNTESLSPSLAMSPARSRSKAL